MMNSCPLPNRAILRLSGADTIELLQGIITNDMALLTNNQPLFAALLSPQGKLQHDFFIIKDGSDVLLDTEAEHKDALIKKLKMYRLRSKVEIADESELWQVVAHWGDDKPSTNAFADPRLQALGWRELISSSAPIEPSTSFEAYDIHRLQLGVPDGSRDATERTVAMDNGYDMLNAISFSKGCYVGQEVTARMHYRKVLRKCLHIVTSDATLPEKGTAILLGDIEIGEMRSSCGNIGLALIQLERDLASAPLTCNGQIIQAQQPEHMKNKIIELQNDASASD